MAPVPNLVITLVSLAQSPCHTAVACHVQASNRGHRAVILALLCDLLENPRSHPFFLAWKSSRDARGSAQLLLSVWREEEAVRGMTAGGVLGELWSVLGL